MKITPEIVLRVVENRSFQQRNRANPMRKPEFLSEDDRAAAERQARRWNRISKHHDAIGMLGVGTLAIAWAGIGPALHIPLVGVKSLIFQGVGIFGTLLGLDKIIDNRMVNANRVVNKDKQAHERWYSFQTYKRLEVEYNLQESAAVRLARRLALEGNASKETRTPSVTDRAGLKRHSIMTALAAVDTNSGSLAVKPGEQAKDRWKRQKRIERIGERAASLPLRHRTLG